MEQAEGFIFLYAYAVLLFAGRQGKLFGKGMRRTYSSTIVLIAAIVRISLADF